MGNGSVYLNLNSVYLDKHRERMKKEADTEGINEEGAAFLTYANNAADAHIEEIDEEKSEMTVQCDTDLGFISIDVPLSTDNLITLIELATKKLNKVKTVLEAVK